MYLKPYYRHALFLCCVELPSYDRSDWTLHSAGVRLLTSQETDQRLCQSWIHQPRQTSQSVFTRGTPTNNIIILEITFRVCVC